MATMTNETNKAFTETTDTTTPKDADLGAAQVKAEVTKETEQGYVGIKVDPTDNKAYTVAGVTSGMPTPETDAKAAAAAAAANGKFAGTDTTNKG